MTAAKAKKRITELRALLDAANHAYYVDTESIMADSEFDALLHELIDLEAQHPELDDPNSPSRRVGGAPIEGFETIQHEVPMLSIDNTFEIRSEDPAARTLMSWARSVFEDLDPDAAEATRRWKLWVTAEKSGSRGASAQLPLRIVDREEGDQEAQG